MSDPSGHPDSRRSLYRTYVSTHALRTDSSEHAQWFPVLDFLPPQPEARVLDVGCGSGAVLRAAAQMGYLNTFGVDISEEQISLALALDTRNVHHGDAIEYLLNTASQWDCIIMTDVLEHFTPDETIGFANAVAVALAPGGLWIVQVPNATSPFFGNYAYGDITHRSVFTEKSLQQVARSVLLQPLGAFPVGVAPGRGLKRRARRVVNRVFWSAYKLALAAETGAWRGSIVSQNIVFLAQKSQ